MLAGGIVLAGQLVPAKVQAQPVAAAQQRYAIAAGSLREALARFGAASGLLIQYEAALLEGRQSPGVQGIHAPDAALAALLAGTGLQAVPQGSGAYALREAPEAPRASSGAPGVLPEVVVTAGASHAPNELPPVYAGGQVASGSRVGLLGNKDFLDTPFSTISYTDEHIQNLQAQEVGRVIAATDPAVVSAQNRHSIHESFFIRGFSANYTDVTYDGLVGLAPEMRIATEISERVEVLKGPSALLNGMPPSGSVGGSINLVPKRAADAPLTRLTTSYESDGLLGLHADVGRRFGAQGQLGIRVNGVLRDGDTAVDNQQQDKRLGALALDWRAERVRLSLDAYKVRDRLDAISYFGIGTIASDVTRLPEPRKGDVAVFAPWSFNIIESETAVLRGEVDLSEQVTAYAAWGRRSGGYNALIDQTTLLNDAGDISSSFIRQATDQTSRSWELGLRGDLETGPARHQWTVTATGYESKFGWSALRPWFSRTTNFYDPDYGAAPDLSVFSASGIPVTSVTQLRSFALADVLSLADDRVQVVLGVRHQQVKTQSVEAATGARTTSYDKSALTPSAAILFKATDRLALYANYIQGLSQGGTAPATAANANEVFAPFKTRQYELGAKYDFGEFAVTAAAFQITRPSAYTDPDTNLYGYHGRQRNRGLELGFFGEAASGVRLMGGVAYTAAQLQRQLNTQLNGNQVTGVPKFVAKLGAEYDVPPLPGLTLTGHVSHSGKHYATQDNRFSVDSYTTLALGARYALELANRPVTLRATVQNVTNEAYWESGWAGGLSGGLGAPRTFLLSASIDF